MAFPVLLQLGAGACWGDDSHHLSSGSCTDVSIMQGEQHAFSEFCFQKVKGKWWRGQASFLFFVFFFFFYYEKELGAVASNKQHLALLHL